MQIYLFSQTKPDLPNLNSNIQTQKMPPSHSIWQKWPNRQNLAQLHLPGIYCIAISKTNLEGQAFNWIKQIKYVGRTNSKAGLKGRLKQFDNTIAGKTGHGGADRFRYKYPDYAELCDILYVSVCPFNCDVTTNQPKDLEIMGEVAKYEYVCFAKYVKLFGQLPEFNDQAISRKHSGTRT